MSSSNTPASHSYEVLYYKRKNKVHKQKGVAKMDGILLVAPKPSCVVTLSDGVLNNDDKKQPTVFSGIHRDISSRAFDTEEPLQVDDIVSLGQYDCEIVNVLMNPTTASGTALVNKKQNNSVSKATLSQSVVRKRPLVPLKNKTSTGGVRLASKDSQADDDTASSRLKKPIMAQGTAARPSWLQNRKPPAQPKRGTESSDDECDDADVLEKENETATSKTTVPKTARFVPQKRKPTVVRSSAGLVQKKKPAIAAPPAPSIFSNAPGIVVPPSIQKALKPHQVEGVSFLWRCLTGQSQELQEAARAAGIDPDIKGAILADEMGLGKTLMTITALFALHRRNPTHRFIVVCPSSLTTNWSKEFDKWIGKASQPKRVVVKKGGENGLKKIRAFVPIKPRLAEVLIISYDLFRMNSDVLTQAKQIGLLVVDEGHKLKNSAGSLTMTALQQLPCEARILISGTPIQNVLTEFHTVADFVCPGLLGDLEKFRREYERPVSAANSKTASREQRIRGHEQSRALDAITKTFMLRRLQKDVLKSTLPPRHELLLFCRPSKQQCELYRGIARRGMGSAVKGGGATAEALTVLTSLRKLCCHPSLAQDSKVVLAATDISSSGKLEILCALLEAARKHTPNDKVVIVSSFTSALSIIEETIIKPHGWPYHRLDGSTAQSERQSSVDSFNRASSSKAFVFLLSSKAGGCGLNMVGANRLVMFDADFNPATDAQAMARIYRQGQTKPCFIYRFFSSGTVEEVVFQRQIHKGNLASITVDGSSSMKKNSSGFTKEELRDCFTLKEGCACDTKRKLGSKWPEYEGCEDPRLVEIGDGPLMSVAQSHSETLTFVHVVEESDDQDMTDDEEMMMNDFGSDQSSGEENEFEDDEESNAENEACDADYESDEEQEFDG